MHLEVGKTYVTKSGNPVLITQEFHNPRGGDDQPRTLFADRGRTHDWHPDGRHWTGGGWGEWDLVTEAESAGTARTKICPQEGAPCRHDCDDLQCQEQGKLRLLDMVSTIPYTAEIRALLDGKVVQARTADGQGWYDMEPGAASVAFICNYPSCAADGGPRFRVKPETVVRWCAVWPNGDLSESHATKLALNQTMAGNEAADYPKVLRVELDPATLDVVDARTEAP